MYSMHRCRAPAGICEKHVLAALLGIALLGFGAGDALAAAADPAAAGAKADSSKTAPEPTSSFRNDPPLPAWATL